MLDCCWRVSLPLVGTVGGEAKQYMLIERRSCHCHIAKHADDLPCTLRTRHSACDDRIRTYAGAAVLPEAHGATFAKSVRCRGWTAKAPPSAPKRLTDQTAPSTTDAIALRPPSGLRPANAHTRARCRRRSPSRLPRSRAFSRRRSGIAINVGQGGRERTESTTSLWSLARQRQSKPGLAALASHSVANPSRHASAAFANVRGGDGG